MDCNAHQLTSDMPPSSRRSIQPTKPIAIPTRRKHVVTSSPYLSPIRDQMSPELIFEMSPLTSEFPRSPNYPLCSSMRQNTVELEPCLYPFPMFSPHHTFSSLRRPSSQTPPCRTSHLPSPKNADAESIINCPLEAWPKPPTTIPGGGRKPQNDSSPNIKGAAKHKITGFAPLYPSPVSDEPSDRTRHRERLSPTPQSPSPWPVANPLDDPDVLEASMYPCFDIDSFMIRQVTETRKSLLHCPSNLRLAHRY